MAKYAVSIHWNDDEDTGTDEFLTLAEAGDFIHREMQLCELAVEDYPVAVYPDQILITRVED